MMRLLMQTLLFLAKHFAPLLDQQRRPNARQTISQIPPCQPLLARAVLRASVKRALQIVEPLEPIVEAPPRMHARQSVTHLCQLLLFVPEPLANQFPQSSTGFRQELAA